MTTAWAQYKKKWRYEITLNANWWRHRLFPNRWRWWDPIYRADGHPFRLVLGALPLASAGHVGKIAAAGVGAVLSLVEPFEMLPGWFQTPATHQDWERQGIAHCHISTPDFKGISQEDIDKALTFVQQQRQQGKTVYIHCKAGRARSAMITICTLMAYEGMTSEQAFETVHACRPHILVDQKKWVGIHAFEKRLPPRS